MAIVSGFHNSINGDRKYGADFFALFFSTLIANGVFPNPSTGLQVIANGNMTTSVKAGRGWINGYFIVNDGDYVLQHDNADGVLKRIDRVVMKLNHITRQIEVVVKKGTFASTPVAPALQRDADVYELALADVLINNGATQITQANITDQRLNTALCGIVHGTVNQVDTTTIFNQYQAWMTQQAIAYENNFIGWSETKREDFDNWFATIQDILDGNVAANLQNLITQNKDNLILLQTQISRHLDEDAIHLATGTANAITISTPQGDYAYGQFKQLKFKAIANNTGNVTINVDGKGAVPALKFDGTQLAAGAIKANKIYEWYFDESSGGRFFLIAKASGNAVAGDVLAGKIFSSDDGEFVGTMVNRGSYRPIPITTQNQVVSIPQGYHDGTGSITANYPGRKYQSQTITIPSSATATITYEFTPDIAYATDSMSQVVTMIRRGSKPLSNYASPIFVTVEQLKTDYARTFTLQAWG